MSKTVDERVVSMQFDNQQFEKNVKTSMSTIERLKQSLNLSGAAKGLENVNTAANNFSVSPLTRGLETVTSKFSALEVMAVTALANITNSAVNAGKRIAYSFTLEPIKTGLAEYETQINAVQTILANTKSKGSTLDNVNKALDELNHYADMTIYNFTEMTRNIGTFTAAGVDLDTSVSAIKGIANLAAVSGSTSQQASTAMYQLSQALASGKVQLQDWNSVVNAGMGGQVFQDALKRTAKAIDGVDVDKLEKKYGSFRETLSKTGWLTSEVLTETLATFTGDLTEQELLAKGYTKEQTAAIIDMGKTANDAATKVKTFTQLMDTLKEAAQSGWTQTWEILIGDFEEAKEMWTKVSDTISDMLNKSAESRNNMLQGWKDLGGRQTVIDGISNAFEGLMNILRPVGEAFREVFPPITSEQLLKFTEGFKNLTERFKNFTNEQGPNIKSTFKGLFSVLDLVASALKVVGGGSVNLLGHVLGLSKGFLSVTGSFGDWLSGIRDSIKETDIFGRAINKVTVFLQKAGSKIKEFFGFAEEKFKAPGFEGFLGVLKGIWEIIRAVATKIAAVGVEIGKAIGSVFQNGNISSILDVVNGGLITTILLGIKKYIGGITEAFDETIGFKDKIKELLGSVGDALSDWQKNLQSATLLKIAGAIGIIALALVALAAMDPKKLAVALSAITVLFAELFGSIAIFEKLVGDNKFKSLGKITTAMIKLSASLLVLLIALKILSSMSWQGMGVALISLTVGLGALVGAVFLLSKFDGDVNKSCKAIQKLAFSLLILSVAMKIMSTISWQGLAVALIGTVVGLGALVGAIRLLPKDVGAKASGLIALSTSLVILSLALKVMATMSWMELAKGLTGIVIGLAAMVGAIYLLPKDTALRVLGLVSLSVALVILSGALKIMASMRWIEIARGLVVLGGALLIIAGAMNLMRMAIPGAAALLIVTAALAVLTPILKILGGMSWEAIAKGLIAIAGAFTIIGLAGLILGPLVPVILALSGAVVLFGIGCLAAGAGISALGVGLSILAASLTTSVAAIVAGLHILIVGILELIPSIAGEIKNSILAIIGIFVECIPAIADGALQLVAGVLEALAKYTPQIIGSLANFIIGLLDGLATHIPRIVKSAVNLLGAIFKGIIDAVGPIDTGRLLELVSSVGILTVLTMALSTITSLIPSAMLGLVGMGALVAEMALVLAAIGKLSEISGLTWFITAGGDLLEAIGTALGQFVGGLAGGIAKGFTSALPEIGSDLSNFMTNASAFIDGAKSIDGSVLTGATTLAGVILALTAADVVNGMASIFTGGNSLSKFGSELGPFGASLKEFSNNVQDIDAESLNGAAEAAKALAKMAETIPNEGGMAAWFTGDNSLAKFGPEMESFGSALKSFSNNVDGVNAEAISAAAKAGKEIAEMANIIPNEGGIKSWFAGDNSLAKFGPDLERFGTALKAFSDNVDGVNPAGIIGAVIAAKEIAKMADTIPNEGGIKAWFAGDNSLSGFGSQLADFGGSLKAFSDSVVGIVPANVTTAAIAAKELAKMADTVPNEGGMIAWFAGNNSLASFGPKIVDFGLYLKQFSDNVTGINLASISVASSAGKTLADMSSVIPNEGGIKAWFSGESGLAAFGPKIADFGSNLKQFSDNVAGINPESIVAAANAGKSLAEMVETIPNEGGIKSWFSGDSSLANFADRLPILGSGLKSFSDSVAEISSENIVAAANAAKSLADMTSVLPNEGGIKAWFSGENSMASFADNLPTLGGGLKGFSDSVSGIKPDSVTVAANAAKNLGDMVSVIPKNTDCIISFGENLIEFGKSLQTYFSETSTISITVMGTTKEAIEAVKIVANELDPDIIASASQAVDSLINVLKDASGIDSTSTAGFVSAINNLASIVIDELLKSFKDADKKVAEAGKELISNFIDGVKSKSKDVSAAFSKLPTEAAKAIRNRKTDFSDAGKHLGNGLVEGINAKQTAVYNAGFKLGQKAVQGEKDGQQSNSPSKLTIQSGKWFGEGLVIGITRMGDSVYKAGYDVGEMAVDSLSSAISRISDVVDSDIDTQPTIRPVLDLSDVTSGAGAIDNLLNSSHTIGLLTNVGRINTMMNQNQNGTTDDVISELKRLAKAMDSRTGDVYNLNGITYDDGSNVSEAVKSLVRAAKIERRV